MNAILAVNYIIVQVEQNPSMPKFLPRFNEGTQHVRINFTFVLSYQQIVKWD